MPKFGNHIKQGLYQFGSFTHGFQYRVQKKAGKILASHTEPEFPTIKAGKIAVTIKPNTLTDAGKQVLQSQGAILYEGTVATRALKDMLEGKLASYEVKLYLQDNNLCWVDLTDRASVNGRNSLLKLGSITYTAERLRGELQQNLSSIQMDNSDGFWDKPFPSDLMSTLDETYRPITPTKAIFRNTKNNQLSSLYRKKVSIRISYLLTGDMHPTTLTLGVFYIEDMNSDYKSKTTSIKLSPINQPLVETPANKIKRGTSWYENASAEFLVRRILEHVYKEKVPLSWEVDVVNNIKVPKSYSNGWAVSDFGKPKEKLLTENSPNGLPEYTFPNGRATCLKDWQYITGTINVKINSNKVYGVGTSWSTDIDTVGFSNAIKVGDSLLIAPEYDSGDGGSAENNDGYYVITEINEAEQSLTLHKAPDGDQDEVGLKYTIARIYVGVGSELLEYHMAADYYEKLLDISESTISTGVPNKRIQKIFYSTNLSTGTTHYPITLIAVSEPEINYNDWADQDLYDIIDNGGYGNWGSGVYNHGANWYDSSRLDSNGDGTFKVAYQAAQKAWQDIDKYNTTRAYNASWINVKLTVDGPSDWSYDTISSYCHNKNVGIENGTAFNLVGDPNNPKFGMPNWELDQTSFVAFRGKDPIITKGNQRLPNTNDGNTEHDNIQCYVMTDELPICLGEIKRAANHIVSAGENNPARAWIGGEKDLGIFIPFKQTVLSLTGSVQSGAQEIIGTRFFKRDSNKYIFSLEYDPDPDIDLPELKVSISKTNNVIKFEYQSAYNGHNEGEIVEYSYPSIANNSIGSTPITFGNGDNTFIADWYKVSAVLDKGYYDASRSGTKSAAEAGSDQNAYDHAARLFLEYSSGGRGVLEKLEGWDYSNQTTQDFDLYFAIGPGPVDSYSIATMGGEILKQGNNSGANTWENSDNYVTPMQTHTPKIRYHWYLIINYRPNVLLNWGGLDATFINPGLINNEYNQVKFFDFDTFNTTNRTSEGRVIPTTDDPNDQRIRQPHKSWQDAIPTCSTVNENGDIIVGFVSLDGQAKLNNENPGAYQVQEGQFTNSHSFCLIRIYPDEDLVSNDPFGIKRDVNNFYCYKLKGGVGLSSYVNIDNYRSTYGTGPSNLFLNAFETKDGKYQEPYLFQNKYMDLVDENGNINFYDSPNDDIDLFYNWHYDNHNPKYPALQSVAINNGIIPYEVKCFKNQQGTSEEILVWAGWRPHAIGGSISTNPSHVMIASKAPANYDMFQYTRINSNDFMQGLTPIEFGINSFTDSGRPDYWDEDSFSVMYWDSSRSMMKLSHISDIDPYVATDRLPNTLQLTDTGETSVDKYQFTPPIYFPNAKEFYWIGSDQPHSLFLADGRGQYNLTKFAPRASVRIDLADFSSMSCWEALGNIAEMANCRYGFYPNGNFFFKKKPRHHNSEYTFTNNGTNGLISDLSKNAGLSMISNVISKIPSFVRSSNSVLNVSLSSKSEYSKVLFDKNGKEIDQAVRHNIELVTSNSQDVRLVLVCTQGGFIPQAIEDIERSDSVVFTYQQAKTFIDTTLEKDYVTPGGLRLPIYDSGNILLASEILATGYSQIAKSDPDSASSEFRAYSQVGYKLQGLRIYGTIDDVQTRIQIVDEQDNPYDLSTVISGLGEKILNGAVICIYNKQINTIEYVIVSSIDSQGGNANNTLSVFRGAYNGYQSVSHTGSDVDLYLISQDNNIIMNAPLTSDGDKIFDAGSTVKIAVPYARNSEELSDDPFSLANPDSGVNRLAEYTPVLGQISWIGGKQGPYSTGLGIIFTAQSTKANKASNHRFSEGDRILIENKGPELVQDNGNIQTARDIDSIEMYGQKESTRNLNNPFYTSTQANWAASRELEEYSMPKYTFILDTLFTPWIGLDSIVSIESESALGRAKYFKEDCYITSMQFDPQARAMVRLTLRSVNAF